MAKVTMPLMSATASGKLAGAMVFFGWKGKAVVRNLVIPTNKMSVGQGRQRVILGGVGKAVGKILPGKNFAARYADNIPGGQTKQSYLVQYIIDTYLGTPSLANYTAMLSAVQAHTGYTGFLSAAEALSIVDFNKSYNTAGNFDKALGLYLIAKAAIALGFTGTPYTLALASWTSASVNSMISDFTNA